MSPQEISDRLEIQDLLVRYCYAVDRRDWKAFERLFVEDAVLDYTAFGGPCSGVKELATHLSDALSGVQGSQHTISTTLLEFDGDTVKAHTAAQVLMLSDKGDGTTHVFFIGLWYLDTLVRTSDGWRINERVQEKSWVHNMPATLQL